MWRIILTVINAMGRPVLIMGRVLDSIKLGKISEHERAFIIPASDV